MLFQSMRIQTQPVKIIEPRLYLGSTGGDAVPKFQNQPTSQPAVPAGWLSKPLVTASILFANCF